MKRLIVRKSVRQFSVGSVILALVVVLLDPSIMDSLASAIEVVNCGSIGTNVTVVWIDSALRTSLWLEPGQRVSVGGVVVGGSCVWDDWQGDMVCVVNSGGELEVHERSDFIGDFVQGLCAGMACTGVFAAVWLVRRGVKVAVVD